MRYVGIDLHSNQLTACFLNDKQNISKVTFKFITPEILKMWLEEKLTKDDYIIVEASTNTFSFCDLIQDKVKEIFVVDPMRFKIISTSGKKTDKIDAEKLAGMGKYHVESGKDFLPEVYVVNEDIRKLRALFKTYNVLKKQCVCIKNRIHSILKQNLYAYKKDYIFSKKKKEEILNLPLDYEYQIQIKILYQTVSHLIEQKEKVSEKIKYFGRLHMNEITILASIKGVSVFSALAIISDYGNIKRFKNAKCFCSYLRSAPKVDASNDKVYIRKTNKRGRKLAISLLAQSLNHFRDGSKYMSDFYIKKSKGKSAGKVRMAVLRKMFVAMYYMLRDKKYYKYSDEKNHNKKLNEYNDFLSKYEEKNIHQEKAA